MLDFSTIKNELFPTVAAVFSKTSSLGIKIRGLEAFVILCGGTANGSSELRDDLNGSLEPSKKSKPSSSSVLDKYTIQEKVVPLMRAMKTKEPAVMMAALAVFKQVGKIADTDFLAMDVLPILWSFSLGPLLNLEQFQEFMNLIKSLSSRIEQEQTRKLRELSSSNANGHSNASRPNDLMNMGSTNALSGTNGTDDVGESDFERLVLGKGTSNSTGNDILSDDFRSLPQPAQSGPAQVPIFSWSTPVTAPISNQNIPSANYGNPGSRAITPDQSLHSFAALNPMSNGNAPAAQVRPNGLSAFTPMQPTTPINPWSTSSSTGLTSTTFQIAQPQSNFSMGPPMQTSNAFSKFSIAPPPSQPQRANTPSRYGGAVGATFNGSATQSSAGASQQSQKKGLDAYQSLL